MRFVLPEVIPAIALRSCSLCLCKMTFAPWSQVLPATMAAFAVAGVLDWLLVHQRVLGGRTLHDLPTFDGKWKEAEKERFLNMNREGAPDEPIIMNPLRHDIPPHIRNAEDLKNL